MATDLLDVLVVGGSWAGLAAAMQLGRTRRRVAVVDAGRPRNRFARTSHGFLGQDGRAPADILETFRAQVLAYPSVQFHTGEATDAAQDEKGDFVIDLAGSTSLRARRLILATGIVDELPPIPGLAERWGVTVLHCPYCHGYEVGDRRLAVIATSERGVHQALLLADWSSQVTLFTNGAFEPDAPQEEALAQRGVRIDRRGVEALVGSAPTLDGVRLIDGGVEPVDAVFTASRTHLTSPLAERLGCAVDVGQFGPIVHTDASKATTIPGVYCAGDAAREPHNATWAAADGATAGVAAHQSLVFAAPPPT